MGFVFVFDMDATLVGSYFDLSEDLDLNPALMKLLKPISIGRSRRLIDGVFLYTNNSDTNYITRVVNAIRLRIPGFKFDDIMSRSDPRRVFKSMLDPPKILEDIKTMLDEKNISTDNLDNRVIFFDDIPNHYLRDEIAENNYVQIIPPYSQSNKEDKTNYSFVKSILMDIGISNNTLSGGTRKKRTKLKTRKMRKMIKLK